MFLDLINAADESQESSGSPAPPTMRREHCMPHPMLFFKLFYDCSALKTTRSTVDIKTLNHIFYTSAKQ